MVTWNTFDTSRSHDHPITRIRREHLSYKRLLKIRFNLSRRTFLSKRRGPGKSLIQVPKLVAKLRTAIISSSHPIPPQFSVPFKVIPSRIVHISYDSLMLSPVKVTLIKYLPYYKTSSSKFARSVLWI